MLRMRVPNSERRPHRRRPPTVACPVRVLATMVSGMGGGTLHQEESYKRVFISRIGKLGIGTVTFPVMRNVGIPGNARDVGTAPMSSG